MPEGDLDLVDQLSLESGLKVDFEAKNEEEVEEKYLDLDEK